MSVKPLYRIPKGSKLTLDGCDWEVVGRTETGYEVEGVETGEITQLSIERIDLAITAGLCEVVTPAQEENRRELLTFTGGFEHIHQLPKDEQKAVRGRLLLVMAMEKLMELGHKLTQRFLELPSTKKLLRATIKELGGDGVFGDESGGKINPTMKIPLGKTLHKYLQLFLKFGRNPVVLMHREHLKGPQGEKRRKLSPLQERVIEYALSHWLKTTKAKFAAVYRLAQGMFDISAEEIAKGFVFPSITTLRTRRKQLPETLVTVAREGEKQSRNLKGAGATAVHAFMFGEETESDEVCLSICVDASGKRKAHRLSRKEAKKNKPLEGEVIRTWLHLMLDSATRMPLAWVMSKTPDGDHGLELQRMATRDKSREAERYGCKHKPAPPVGILLGKADNGTAIRNSRVRTAQLGAGMTLIDGRTYTAPDKPHAEAIFGTVQWDLLNFLPGYTGSRPGELPGYDPVKNAVLTPDEIYGAITRYLVDEYPFRPHYGTGMFGATPMQKFEENLAYYGGIQPPSQRDRRIHLGLTTEVSTTSEGVKAFNLPYNSTELQHYAGGASKPVTVHIDPDYPQIASITVEGTDIEIEARLTMSEFNDLTLDEILDVMTKVAEDNPGQREYHRQQYREAVARRARSSGFFEPVDSPATYDRLRKLQRKADLLAGIDVGRPSSDARMARSGSVMARMPSTSAATPSTPATPGKPKSSPLTFTPIKDSKL